MDTRKIVMHEMQGNGVFKVLIFLLNPLVSRVKRRIPIRMVRFWRST